MKDYINGEARTKVAYLRDIDIRDGEDGRKKGCEFCNTSNRLSEENGFLVVGKELLFHYEFSEDDGDFIRMFADVNYCPMCGREL